MSRVITEYHLLLLLIAAYAPRFGECSSGGRDLNSNEFQYIVFVRGLNADNSTGGNCLGILYGSITVITAPMCFPKAPHYSGAVGEIRTSKNMFVSGETEMWIPVMELRYSDYYMPSDYPFTFAILNLEMPGVMVDAYMGPDAANSTTPDDGNSTGVKIVDFYASPFGVTALTEDEAVGVVPTPDKKVVAMKLLRMKECTDRYNNMPDENLTDFKGTAICAVAASAPVTRLTFEAVPPGYVCDSDAGSPFVYGDLVVGLLVKAFCGSGNPLAIFLSYYAPPFDELIIEHYDTYAPNDSTPQPTSDIPDYPTGPTTPPGKSEGLSIHTSLLHTAFITIAFAMIVKQTIIKLYS